MGPLLTSRPDPLDSHAGDGRRSPRKRLRALSARRSLRNRVFFAYAFAPPYSGSGGGWVTRCLTRMSAPATWARTR